MTAKFKEKATISIKLFKFLHDKAENVNKNINDKNKSWR
jgi:hypothetical protein